MAVRAIRTQDSNRRNTTSRRPNRQTTKAANDNNSRQQTATNDDKKLAQIAYRKARARERRRESDSEQPKNNIQKIARARKIVGRKKGLKKLLLGDSTEAKRILAFSAALPIFGFLPPLIGFQFIFWVLQLAGFFVESIPFINFVLPAEAVVITAYILITITNLILAISAVMLFFTRGVDCLSGKKSLVFMICVTMSMLPILHIFPWIALWLLFVIYQQKDGAEGDTDPEETE